MVVMQCPQGSTWLAKPSFSTTPTLSALPHAGVAVNSFTAEPWAIQPCHGDCLLDVSDSQLPGKPMGEGWGNRGRTCLPIKTMQARRSRSQRP